MSAKLIGVSRSGDCSLLRSAIIFIEEDDGQVLKLNDDEICNQLIDSNGYIKFAAKLDENGRVLLNQVEIVGNDLTIPNPTASLTILMPQPLKLADDMYYQVRISTMAELSVLRLVHKSQQYSVYRCAKCREVSIIKPNNGMSPDKELNLLMQARQVQQAVLSLLRESSSSHHLSITNYADNDNDTNGLPATIFDGLFQATSDSCSNAVSLVLPTGEAGNDIDTLIARALRLLSLLPSSNSNNKPLILVIGPCNTHQVSLQMLQVMKERSIFVITWSTKGSANNTQKASSDLPHLSLSLAVDSNNSSTVNNSGESKSAAGTVVEELSSVMITAWETLKGEIERRLLWPRYLPPLLLSRLGLSSSSNSNGQSQQQQQQQQQQVMGGWAVCGPVNSAKTTFTLAIVQSYLPPLLGNTHQPFSVLQPSLARVISGSIGGSESNLLQLFHEAISKAPAVLILSEAKAMLNLTSSNSGNSSNSMVAALLQGLALLSSWNQQQLAASDKDDVKLVFCVLVWRGVAANIPSALIRPDRLWPAITLPSRTAANDVFNPFLSNSSALDAKGRTNHSKREARIKRDEES